MAEWRGDEIPHVELYLEDIRMAAGINKRQRQDIVFNPINKQSVWLDAALTEAGHFLCQCMVGIIPINNEDAVQSLGVLSFSCFLFLSHI